MVVAGGYPNKRARTQRLLVRGAMEVMAGTDSDVLTAAAVARAAGVSNGTLYNHFDGVDALGDAVTSELASLFELGAGTLSSSLDDPAARVATGVRRVLATAEADPAYARAFLVAVARRPAFRAHIRGLVQGEVAKGLRSGVFRAPSVAVVTDALMGTTLQALRSLLLGEAAADAVPAVLEVALRLLGVAEQDIPTVINRTGGATRRPAA